MILRTPQRMNVSKTNPDEGFIVRNSKLFCHACKEVLALKKSSIEYHIKSQKHISMKKKLSLKNKEESNILEVLHMYDVKSIQLVMVYQTPLECTE